MSKYRQIIFSILDNDLYAFTMSQAALNQYPEVVVDDELIVRDDIYFPEGFADELKAQICLMANLSLSADQKAYLLDKCYYLKRPFLDWLENYRFDPSEVNVSQNHGQLSVKIHGRFCRTVLWETPILALISELFFKMMGQRPDGRFIERAAEKAIWLRAIGARYSEFGTRRRFSWYVQDRVLKQLIETSIDYRRGGVLNGTSNVQLAMKYGLVPMGTNAHKWYQLHAGLFGVRMANRMAMEAWQKEFDTRLGIVLTDTFTTDDFLLSFDRHMALLHDGVRHDSGDPFEFVEEICRHYESLNIDPKSKTILFSDGLDINKVNKILVYVGDRIKCAFGIGTNLSNDIAGVTPLKIVIKQTAVYLPNGRKVDTVKLSDDPNKASGDTAAINNAKYELGLT